MAIWMWDMMDSFVKCKIQNAKCKIKNGMESGSCQPQTADCAASLAVEKAICKLNPPV